MSDLIANWIRPGSFVIFHYFNRNWNCCDYGVLLSCAFSKCRIVTHFNTCACRNSLAMLFYAVFINKRDTLQKRNFHIYSSFIYLFWALIQINIYYITNLLIRSFMSLFLECRIIKKRKEMWDRGKNYKIHSLIYTIIYYF